MKRWREIVIGCFVGASLLALAIFTTSIDIQVRKLTRVVEARGIASAVDSIRRDPDRERLIVALEAVQSELAGIRKLLEDKP